ncbi:DUF2971 domain-containing protein [Dyella psychrodurans]|uniref:DUF2971 domain-containing protein n=1 Tax=Dyella psychrodurans TaxID=1927960 RepID=A0A370X716_9GAMM|nr:DUF2971 domain-containing protein [Dyella psychrodurans]RDS84168.1 DUF2971 domain-containing protein [Dyella psychrodurans]
MLLYKYRDCAQRTWELLLSRKLFFATPEQLNDPLDSSIDIQAEYERAKELVRESDDHPDLRNSFLVFLLDGYHRFHDPTTGKRIGLNKALQHFIQSLGILSFSRVATDALLWSHYAEGHCGLCLGFDPELLEFEDVFIKGDVEYASKPPYVDLFVKMTKEIGEFVRPWENHKYPREQGDQFYTSQLSRLMHANLLVKSEKWRYEEEYRMVTSRPGLHSFSPKALREVIQGTKMREGDREKLADILCHRDYSHVRVRSVQNVPGTFDFELAERESFPRKRDENGTEVVKKD